MIDFHYHYSSYAHNSWSPANSIDAILREMAALQVERRLLFPYFNPMGYAASQANAEIIAACQQAPEHLLPVIRAQFPLDLKHEFKIKLETINAEYQRSILNIVGAVRLARSKAAKRTSVDDFQHPQFDALPAERVAGLKFHGEEDGSLTTERFREIQERFRLLIIHIDPFELEILLRRVGVRPDFTIILAHLGSFSLLNWQVDKALALTRQYDRLYVDCSAIFAKNMLEHYLPLFGNKIVFGSDGPCFSTKATLELLKEVGCFEQVRNNSYSLANAVL